MYMLNFTSCFDLDLGARRLKLLLCKSSNSYLIGHACKIFSESYWWFRRYEADKNSVHLHLTSHYDLDLAAGQKILG